MKNLLKALETFQSKNIKIKKDGLNPHYKSEYITLDSILETVKPILSSLGLLVIQTIGQAEKGFIRMITKIYHSESGDCIESVFDMPVPGNQSSQSYGMAVTYARRYSLVTLLGITADDDTDIEPEKIESKIITKQELVKKNVFDFSNKYPELTKRLADLPDGLKLTNGDREALFGVDMPLDGIKNYVEGFLGVREREAKEKGIKSATV